MQFNSWEYLFFITLIFALYWIQSDYRTQNHLLLFGSYYFYASWDWRFLSLIIASTIADFIAGKKIYRAETDRAKKYWLVFSIFVNLSLLGVFKYFNFFVQSASVFLSAFGLTPNMLFLDIALPVGISFYTFQTMSYSLDIYRGQLKPISYFPDFALFVSFFPQLVAGPIERARNLLPQIQKPRQITRQMINTGLTLIGWGLWKKIVVADNLGYITDSIFLNSDSATVTLAYLGINAFAWQVYCDFSAYSDIARGSARILGFNLMLNFNLPFFASNINELWRRWHISLSTWLRDYLYRPLGGSLHSKGRTALNIFVVMFLCGLWHGAGWNYVAWGVYLGAAMLVYNAFVKPFAKGEVREFGWRWFLNVALTYHLFTTALLPFRSSRHVFDGTRFVDDSANQIMEMLTSYRNGLGFNQEAATILFHMSVFILPMIIIQTFQYVRDDHLFFLKMGPAKRVLFFSFLIFYLLYFGIQGGDQFIYFQF